MQARLDPRVVCTFAAVIACFSHAQSYPNRPIRLIVPSAPGGSPDISARMFRKKSHRASASRSRSVIVQDTYGAAGIAPQGGAPDQFTEFLRAEWNYGDSATQPHG